LTRGAEARQQCVICDETIERLLVWLGSFHRMVVGYERHALTSLDVVHLGFIPTLL
jgi:hypothetical protein